MCIVSLFVVFAKQKFENKILQEKFIFPQIEIKRFKNRLEWDAAFYS
jgi:hypothetical protein